MKQFKNVNTKKEDKNMKLIIYYKNKKTSNLLIKNITTPNLVYEYKCPMTMDGWLNTLGWHKVLFPKD